MSRALPAAKDFGGMLAARLGRRFAAGPEPADAVAVASDLRTHGLLVMCEYVAHPARTDADAETSAARLVDLVEALRAPGLTTAAQVDLLVPLGSLGSGASATGRLRLVCDAAAAAGTRVTVRPSSAVEVDAALSAAAVLRTDHRDTGVEVWAALRRTAVDLDQLGVVTDDAQGPRVLLRPSGEGVRVPAPLTLPGDTDVDRAFIRYAKRLMRGVARPILAPPDPTLVAIVEMLADEPPQPREWELLMDMGRRSDEADTLSALGRPVRVKVPFGPRWRAVGVRAVGTRAFGGRAPRVPRRSAR